MNSLQLDASGGLLIANGSLVVATGNYAIAQNVATALSTFRSELWYDTTFGVPYLQQILGKRPSLAFVKSQLTTIAMMVNGVASAVAYLTGPVNRTLGGQVQLFGSSGEPIGAVATSNLAGSLPWYVLAATPSATGSSASGGAVITGGASILTGGSVEIVP